MYENSQDAILLETMDQKMSKGVSQVLLKGLIRETVKACFFCVKITLI